MNGIRPLRPDDLPEVLGLIGPIYREYGLLLDVEADEPHLINPCEYFRSRGGEFWVLEEGRELCGTAAFLLRADHAELKSMYVRRNLRGTGLGGKLLSHVIDHIRRLEMKRLTAWSDTRFVDAHRFYRGKGFILDGIRCLFDGNDSWEYAFHLNLT